MSEYVRGLKCRLCGKAYAKEALNFCTDDFGPLEADYDYDAIREVLSRGKIELRPFNMYAAAVAASTASRLVAGRRHAVGPGRSPAEDAGRASYGSRTTRSTFPTLSFKDRVVSVPELKASGVHGFKTVGCAPTGNLRTASPPRAASPA